MLTAKPYSLIHRRILALSAICLSSSLAPAQGAGHGHAEPYRVRSGNHVNPTTVEGVAVWQHVLTLPPSVPWLRVHFSRAQLGKGSYVKVTSLKDGDSQVMHQEHLEQWQFGSAFFNGHAVLIELVAGAKTGKNFIEIEKVWAGDAPSTQSTVSICGTTDDRVPSANNAVGRLVSSSNSPACTGWIIGEPAAGVDRCHLSAGHCFPASAVLQFNVPASNANCTAVHPPANLQFAVDLNSVIYSDGGAGNDYAVFRCFRNSNTNLTTWQQMAASITLAAAMPTPGVPLRITGFGVDGSNTNNASGGNNNCACVASAGTGQRNLVQQTRTGTLDLVGAFVYYRNVDTCPGDSGSPVLHGTTGEAIAIHTHGGCDGVPPDNFNRGTAITLPGLRAAINLLCRPAINDECTSADWIVDGVNGPYDNTSATTSSGAWPCQAQTANDLWFSYVATCTGNVTIDTCAATRTFDTVLQVFSGECGALTSVGCSDDTCGVGSSVTFAATASTRYYVRVGGYQGQRGAFSLTITGCNAADECSGAIPLPQGGGGPYSNAAATTSARAWQCVASVGNDIWFRYEATCASRITFSTCWNVSNFDTVLEVLHPGVSGTCLVLQSIGCSDDDPTCGIAGNLSRVDVTVTAPTTLYVRVGGYNGARGRFYLSAYQTPTNDECANAVVVNAGVNGPFCNIGATAGMGFECNSGGSDVWFRYTATCTGFLVADTCSATRNFDTMLEIYSGSCTAWTRMGCNDDACGLGSSLTVPVNASQTYWLRVGGFENATGRFDLTLRCTPPNDECANAVSVTTGVNGPFSNQGATSSPPSWPCAGAGGTDVWYQFVPTCSAPHTFRTCSTTRTFDTTLEVFSGSCGTLTSIGCSDDVCGTGSSVTAPLLATQTYYVRVGGWSGAQGAFDLEIREGTGAGSLVRQTTGCGVATLVATGNPNIGGTVQFQLNGLTGAPLLLIGYQGVNFPFCQPAPCILGAMPAIVIAAPTYSLAIPCNEFIVGARLWFQGVDFAPPGACPALGAFLTDTFVLTIG